MANWKINIEGIVQGVGFRPYIYNLALKKGLKGTVQNGSNGVTIFLECANHKAQEFYNEVITSPPRHSRITRSSFTNSNAQTFTSFQIIKSKEEENKTVLLTPDFAICTSCRGDIKDHTHSKYQYPFTTCTDCGPRYSIIKQMPYDRINTSMSSYNMCQNCGIEYNNPSDRRYYSQTNSCIDCGVKQLEFNKQKKEWRTISTKSAIYSIINHWNENKVVAIKGIGGFILTCDASNSKTINKLRKLKNRPSKPFAVMIPSTEYLDHKDSIYKELEELTSEVTPIVLLNNSCTSILPHNTIAPALETIGVLLPYTPLYEILLSNYGKPIVATSANISGSPICYLNSSVSDSIDAISDYIVSDDRDIVVPQDDSLISFTPWYKQKIILRRSRGLAPNVINYYSYDSKAHNVIACGSDLKASIGIIHQSNIYVSQYIGDLAHFGTQSNYKTIQNHLLQVFDTTPDCILCDKHPAYHSVSMAEELSSQLNLFLQAYQHHKAHFAAILGEHGLMKSEDSILGVIWDGTGYGDDGHAWGGEFFTYDSGKIKRLAHWNYFKTFLGDKFAKEPRLSALSLSSDAYIHTSRFTSQELDLYQRLITHSQTLTSSMGRIFDAVSAILDLGDKQSYEGENALKLEALARKGFKENGRHYAEYYEGVDTHSNPSSQELIHGIIVDQQNETSHSIIAAKFHNTLVQTIKRIAQKNKIKSLAFSGGVFQNTLLVDLLIDRLSEYHSLYFHHQLSPNDENISFGQLMLYNLENKSL